MHTVENKVVSAIGLATWESPQSKRLSVRKLAPVLCQVKEHSPKRKTDLFCPVLWMSCATSGVHRWRTRYAKKSRNNQWKRVCIWGPKLHSIKTPNFLSLNPTSPGLGRSEWTLQLSYVIVQACRAGRNPSTRSREDLAATRSFRAHKRGHLYLCFWTHKRAAGRKQS